ncbi:MAG: hypothetical protein K940chlam9_00537 [Chlamydiae bacterium]|nr:hypothetical protein [Chlamydiota bacterium]
MKEKAKIYDEIRKKWVEATPEEIIRQNLLHHMVQNLGYPKSLIALEKELSTLPHLSPQQKQQAPKRRLDILVYQKKSFLPLLLIECKAIPLTPNKIHQVLGYNTFVQAPYIGLCNEKEIWIANVQEEEATFAVNLPPYSTLVET